jgi:hypothetical protein
MGMPPSREGGRSLYVFSLSRGGEEEDGRRRRSDEVDAERERAEEEEKESNKVTRL